MAKKTSGAKKRDTLRVLIVEARFYEHIADALLKGRRACSTKPARTTTASRCRARSKFPRPSPSRSMPHKARRAPYDGVVALGCVIQGETYHFELVSNELARGLMDLSIDRQIALGNGILTVDNEAQALARRAPTAATRAPARRVPRSP